MRKRKPAKFFLFKLFNKGFTKVENGYGKIVGIMLKHPVISMSSFVVIAIVAIWGFTRIPTSYIPQEDMGYFMTNVQLPSGASLERTEAVMNKLSDEIRKIPGVKDVMSITGFSFMAGGSGSNLGAINVILDPWGKRSRGEGLDKIMAKVDEISKQFQEANIVSINPPSIPGQIGRAHV